MIDFNTYEEVNLEDVAEYERAKVGHIYPRGATILQVSATKGELGFLYYPQEVLSKYVVIIPSSGVDPKYFNFIMQKNIDKFMVKYLAGLNLQEQDVRRFPIQLHNTETQKAIVRMLEHIDSQIDISKQEIEAATKFKRSMLSGMMI